MSLPFESAEATVVEARSLILYGPPKVGKTEAVAKLPGALIVQVEAGADTHKCTRTPPIKDYSDFMATCDVVIKAGRPYKYVVFDTIDAMEEMAQVECTFEYKRTPIGSTFGGKDICSELPNGAGYLWLRRVLNRMVDKACATVPPNGCAIFIGHIKDKLLNKPGIDVQATDLALTGKCGVIMCSRVDGIGHMSRKARPAPTGTPTVEDLRISFRSSDTVNCGSRIPYLGGKEFVFAPGDTRTPNWALLFPSLGPVSA